MGAIWKEKWCGVGYTFDYLAQESNFIFSNYSAQAAEENPKNSIFKILKKAFLIHPPPRPLHFNCEKTRKKKFYTTAKYKLLIYEQVHVYFSIHTVVTLELLRFNVSEWTFLMIEERWTRLLLFYNPCVIFTTFLNSFGHCSFIPRLFFSASMNNKINVITKNFQVPNFVRWGRI